MKVSCLGASVPVRVSGHSLHGGSTSSPSAAAVRMLVSRCGGAVRRWKQKARRSAGLSTPGSRSGAPQRDQRNTCLSIGCSGSRYLVSNGFEVLSVERLVGRVEAIH